MEMDVLASGSVRHRDTVGGAPVFVLREGIQAAIINGRTSHVTPMRSR